MSRLLGALLVLSAGVCWGTAGILGKLVMDLGYSPLTVVAYRLVFGYLILLTIALLWKGKKALAVGRRGLALLILSGTVGVGSGMVFYFWAVDLVGASLAVILLYTAPAFTLITAKISLHEQVSKVKVAAVLLVFLGIYLAVKGYDLAYVAINYLGIAAGFLAGFFYSTYVVVSKKAMSEGAPAFTAMLLTTGFGALAVMIAEAAMGFAGIELTAYSATLIAALAIIPTALASLLFILGLNLTEAGKANIYSTVEAVTAVILAFMVLGERLDALQILGCALVIVSVATIYGIDIKEVQRGY